METGLLVLWLPSTALQIRECQDLVQELVRIQEIGIAKTQHALEVSCLNVWSLATKFYLLDLINILLN